jgi:hypothetical protein
MGSSATLWSAILGAQGSPFVFAIAAGDGVITMDPQASTMSWMHPPTGDPEHGSTIFAVGCLSQHPSVVLAGTRSGSITGFDVRLRTKHLGFEKMRHPSTVYQIKQLNDNLIVVAGLNSTLCNYDLRFIQQRPLDKTWPNRTWLRGLGLRDPQFQVSNPVLIYPGHSNDAHTDLGFDIDPDAGIVAAVQANDFSTVKIFSSKSGEVLRSLNPSFAVPRADLTSVKAVRFVQDCDSRHMKSLWVAKGTKMVHYAW